MSQQSLFSFAKPSAVSPVEELHEPSAVSPVEELHVDHQDNYPSPPSSSMFEVSSSSTENSTGIGMKRAYDKEGNSGGGKRIKVNKFQYSWNKRWPWLLFKEDLGMFCKLCTSIYPSDDIVFVGRGSKDFKTSALLRHASSKKHQSALEREKIAQSSNLKVSVQKSLTTNEESIVASMKAAYFMAKQDIAMAKHSAIMDLLKCVNSPCINSAPVYSHSSFIEEFHEIFYEIIQDQLLNIIQSSPFMSVIIDESTDIGVHKKLIVYVKLLNGSEIETHFLHNTEVINGTAMTITEKLKEMFLSLNIPWNKVVCVSSDGASVMVGRINGVSTKLKQINPAMINIHCAGHRLSLAVSQATEGIPYFTNFKANVKALFNFFHYSAVRYNRLREIQDLLNEPQARISEWHSVRWLSLEKAVSTIMKTYGAIIVTLDQEALNNPTAKGLSKFMATPKYVLVCGFLLDVLKWIEPLNKMFQLCTANFATIKPLVSATISGLEELRQNTGLNEKRITENLKENSDYQDIPLDLSDRIESEVSSLKISYLENIIANLKKRFPEEDTALLSKFDVLNPTTWPANSCQLKSFGTAEVIHLSKHYQEYIPQDLEDLPTQWHMFVSMVYENYSNSLTSFKMLADLVFNRLCVPFPSISVLYKIAAVLCISSADCERGFSVQNIIKTHKRSSLKTITVQRLQMIKLEGPSIHDFDFHTALLKFKLRKERRNRKKNT